MKNHKTKNFLIIGTVFCALGTVLFASGIAAGGREYIKNTDLNTYNGSFSSEKSDSNHAILEKEKIDAEVAALVKYFLQYLLQDSQNLQYLGDSHRN